MEPRIVFAPWINLPNRGKWLNILDRLILKIPIINRFYLKYLINKSYKVVYDGNINKDKMLKYKKTKINPKFYGKLK